MKLIDAIIIGDEILSGKREDKHLRYLTQKLRKAGFALNKADFIPDDLDTIISTIRSKLSRVVFCFGGIGATPDDCTREAAARAHDLIIERHLEATKCIEKQFGEDAYPKRILTADLPYQANLIPNSINNIPGFSINDHHFMPGFPEMSWPMLDWLLETYYRDNQLKIDIKDSSVWIDNVSESQLIDLMNQIISNNKDIKLYCLPKMDPKKTLELGIKGSSKNVDKAIKEIKSNLSHLNINWRDNT
jgi:molybdopterin-biosynthesis enzyme MoeA-like protein